MAQMQLTVYDFVQPFGGALDEENRWVRLAKKIDWLKLEKQYAVHFGKGGADVQKDLPGVTFRAVAAYPEQRGRV